MISERKIEMVKFFVDQGALLFGQFTLKSGRKSPYFFNSGKFDDGRCTMLLAAYYAYVCASMNPVPNVVFGPAYKGIPLAVSTAAMMFVNNQGNPRWCFDRKEAKDHGDGGSLVGHVPVDSDKIAILDDVITTVATKIKSIELLRSVSDAEIVGLVVILDRCEQTPDGQDPVATLANSYSVQVTPLLTIVDVLEALREKHIEVAEKDAAEMVTDYLRKYGMPEKVAGVV